MDEPAIVSYGRQYVKNYDEQEFKESLVRAFKEKRADFITLDSNPSGQRFLSACVAWACDREWLYNDRNSDDDQSEVSSFRLTDKGKAEVYG